MFSVGGEDWTPVEAIIQGTEGICFALEDLLFGVDEKDGDDMFWFLMKQLEIMVLIYIIVHRRGQSIKKTNEFTRTNS